jgi:predicted nucleic acid-binding protein
VIYVDTSVALAQLLSEKRRPAAAFWAEDLVTSRLLAYEAWTRILAMGLGTSHAEALRSLVGHMLLLELSPPVLSRAMEPFPIPVRTLDALHLASLAFMASTGRQVALATYDDRLRAAAQSIGVTVVEP